MKQYNRDEYFLKQEDKMQKWGKEKNWGRTVKIKMQPNKINLMIERARQKNSAPIAKRISGDGAFLSIQYIYFWVEFI